MTDDLAWSLLLISIVVAGTIWLFVTAGRRHRGESERQAKWHYAYFYQGGLIRSLLGRQPKTKLLTDERDDSERSVERGR